MVNYTPKDAAMDDSGFGIFISGTSGEEPPHTHGFIEFVYLLAGVGTQTVGGRSFTVTKGDLLFIDRNRTHCFSAPEGMTYVNIALEPTFIGSSLTRYSNTADILSVFLYGDLQRKMQLDPPLFHFRGAEMLKMDSVVSAMNEEFTARKPEYRKIVSSYLNIFFLLIARSLQNEEGNVLLDHIRKSMTWIVDYINKNSGEKITLEEIAAKSYYSPAYFSRLFKSQFGVNFTEYLQQKRIDKALHLLSDPALTVERIGETVGYGDRKSFTTAFKKTVGVTPNAFRRQLAEEGKYPEDTDKGQETLF